MDSSSVVKFNGLISEPFSICQGVKQGGILSADLYKLYINNLLTDIEHSGLGAKIGSICCAAPTCADDVALMSDNPEELQVLINMAYNYSQRERYKLQPVKSVILPVYPNRRKQQEPSFPWSIGNSIMPIVSQTTHMGVLRTSKPDDPNPLYENVKKARRAMYSLMPAGLHGKNGLDIQSLLHIFNIYVIPVLLYGLELVTPTGKNLDIIDIFHKKCIKQLLSLPTSTATPAIYILSGQLPIEGQIHKKILSLFGNISRQPQNSLEKQIAYRQLLMKTDDSNSWFIIVKTILAKYNLPSALHLLDSQIQKLKWKTMVNKEVSKYWKHFIEGHCKLYPSLKYLNSQYIPGKTHVLVNLSASNSMQEAMRIPVKLRIATGSYILMADRTRHSKNKGLLATCPLCQTSDETLEHFLLLCPALSNQRKSILSNIQLLHEKLSIQFKHNGSEVDLIQVIIDSSTIGLLEPSCDNSILMDIEFQSRRLCFLLHTSRSRILNDIDRT
ncbi:unnamed protein product [Mytilus edulis]|uniref:Reverse transcriptase domain-containing protein n=1 Tax=Mytilus edulis TaxID=6550 RepID=A0A8S3QLQ8_MYTED|nr:unnamed protein product [Mytilus edulis]